MIAKKKIAVVIPCYRVKKHIMDVLARMPSYVDLVFVVDDQCPEGTGSLVASESSDSRVTVIFNEKNKGVGGATVSGFHAAIQNGADICLKIDGDGQMAPEIAFKFLAPILKGDADLTKGNRFFAHEDVGSMPFVRLVGNAILSFVAKVVTGHWHVMDPNNGYIAVHARLLKAMPLSKLDERYFFETDLLFRAHTLRARVVDIPMKSVYGEESSNLNISRVVGEFPPKYLNRLLKRIYYSYFLRDFNFGSLALLLGIALICFSVLFGGYHWWRVYETGLPTHLGTIMLATLSFLIGFQMLLTFLVLDIFSAPKTAIHPLLLDSSYDLLVENGTGYNAEGSAGLG